MLNPLGDSAWEIYDPLKVLGLMPVGHRMTVLGTSSGLVIHSPVAYRDDLGAELADLGEVTAIVVPSVFHDLYLAQWFERYPSARVFAAAGVTKPLPEHTTLPEWPDDLAAEIDIHLVGGMPRVNESVFFHHASKALVVADLVFNLSHDAGIVGATLLRLAGTYKRTAMPRLLNLLIKDREALRASLGTILKWNFERIAVGHGDVIERDAQRWLRKLYDIPA